MKDLKIVFMGTPDFAVTILDRMLVENMNIIGVVTAPDRPAGRGRKIAQSSVKKYSIEKGLNILQPTSLKDRVFIEELESMNADLFVVVAFRMLPEVVWAMPPKGTINLHASLLPNYRGAAPINWAIINGEVETGVTTFFIEKEIDTGKIILREKIDIPIDINAGNLHDKLAALGAKTMVKTIKIISTGSIDVISQDQMELDTLKSAPKIFKQDCQIDWNKPAKEVHDFIRGLDPYPGAWSHVTFKGKELLCKFFKSRLKNSIIKSETELKEQIFFRFKCRDTIILVEEIQIEGKKRVKYEDFVKGNSINDIKVMR